MKKALIILTILSLALSGFIGYKGYQYINSLQSLAQLHTTKKEIIETNIVSEQKNVELEAEYKKKTQDLLNNNLECELWQEQEEALKKIKE